MRRDTFGTPRHWSMPKATTASGTAPVRHADELIPLHGVAHNPPIPLACGPVARVA